MQASVSYTLGADVENLTLTGTGNINATGNTLSNTLTGNAGNNVLDGGSRQRHDGGRCRQRHLRGRQRRRRGDGRRQPGHRHGAGSVSYTLGANVENLTLTGTGNINATGNTLDNTLTGNAGNNILDGGAGNDTLIGGAGNDTYVVDSAGDVVTESSNEGTDTVQSQRQLHAGRQCREPDADRHRQHQRHRQHADQHADRQRRQQHAGRRQPATTRWGGAGNDTYVVDSAGDVVTEGSGEGTDTVQASVSYTLGADVENLTLTGTGNINATGNTLANTLTGNAGNNVLRRRQSATTRWSGGAGNDTYVVDSAGDVVTEGGNQGTDTVQASVSYTLGGNVENLTLTGTGNINATGNTLDNTLTGNAGNNILNGGAGDDTHDRRGRQRHLCGRLRRRRGDGGSNEGTDTVQASVSYTLGGQRREPDADRHRQHQRHRQHAEPTR